MCFTMFGIQLSLSRAEAAPEEEQIERLLAFRSLEGMVEQVRTDGLMLSGLGGLLKSW